MTQNHLIRLKSRPRGLATRNNFTIATEPVAPLRDDAIAIETRVISLDPAMRGWMNEGKSYIAPVDLSGVMRAYAAGHVVASRHADFRAGDAVVGLFGVQSHPVMDGKLALKVDTRQAPLERWIGGLGMPGGRPTSGSSRSASRRLARHSSCPRPPGLSAPWSDRSARSRDFESSGLRV